jgi:hypothetical protein
LDNQSRKFWEEIASKSRHYGSCLEFSQEPEKMQAKAKELKAEGYSIRNGFSIRQALRMVRR